MSLPTPSTASIEIPPAGERSCAPANPESKAATVAAFRAVTLHTIVDAFDLRWEEAAVTGVRLDEMLSPLLVLKANSVPLPARREMLEGVYSRMLSRRRYTQGALQVPMRNGAAKASLSDWSESLLNPIFTSYGLTPIQESRMHMEMRELLSQLGVGDHANPRPALYLPLDLRQRLARHRTP